MIRRFVRFIYSKYKHTTFGYRLSAFRHHNRFFAAIWERLFSQGKTTNKSAALNTNTRIKTDSRTGLTLQIYAKTCEKCESLKDTLKADVYIAHLVQSAVFFNFIAPQGNSKLICDVVEHPRLDLRAVKSSLPKIDLQLLHDIFDSSLRKCECLFTVSHSLSEHLEKYNVPVAVLENFRYQEEVPQSQYFRDKFNLPKDADIVLCMSLITTGFEDVLRAMAILQPKVHLVAMGRFFPEDYLRLVKSMASELGVGDRLHFHDPVPYNILTSAASSADIGIIVRDPAILNNYISLPNRVFDYICSGLPICSPYMPDIANIINKYELGTVLDGITAEDWAEGIEATLANKDKFSENAKRAAGELTWESKEPMIMDIIGDAKTVTIFSQKDLANNNRSKRIARALAKNGVQVKICSPNVVCKDIDDPNIKFYQFPT